jgi:hypothetical protein
MRLARSARTGEAGGGHYPPPEDGLAHWSYQAGYNVDYGVPSLRRSQSRAQPRM